MLTPEEINEIELECYLEEVEALEGKIPWEWLSKRPQVKELVKSLGLLPQTR
ncbi:hypothetical protein Q9X91_004636 [Vibrio alginolyticus]|nr:hypothetical protein [Vibrio alginolyticus]